MAKETNESQTKRRKLSTSSSSRWSELHDDILIIILRRLSGTEVLRFSLVCTSWFKVVQAWKSSSSFTPKYAAPWLTLPPVIKQDSKEEDMDGCSLVSLEEKRWCKRLKICSGYGKSRCIGSSHGWLVLLDESANLYLINPCTRQQIKLPSSNTLEDVVNIHIPGKVAYVRNKSDPSKPLLMSLQQFRESFIYKAILSADPSHSKDFGVILIYNNRSKIAFCKYGNIDWKDLDGGYGFYHDIICKNNQVFALSVELFVEVWNISTYQPVKVMEIKNCGMRDKLVDYVALFPLYSMRWYLVESLGHILLVSRICARFLNKYDLPNIEDHSLPYKTLKFNVYKFEPDLNRWVQMDSLGDRVLFLGGNHSTSLSTQDYPQLKNNTIYFTDDYWRRINEARSYGGHDLGIFNLQEKIVRPFSKSGQRMIRPPPFWVAPNPWERKI